MTGESVYAHVPVLLDETVSALLPKRGGTYVDGTLGRAGHAAGLLARCNGEATLLGIDRDPRARIAGAERLAAYPEATVKLVHGRHGDLAALAAEAGLAAADGVMLDLGVSSPQLDKASRGFSFLRKGPLDMRMDDTTGRTAADLVNGASADELARIFRDYGDESQARRLALAIARERAKAPFETTVALADFIERTVGRHGPHHPATRIFQALRMAVNDEVGELERALVGGLGLLKPGGRFAVITFESVTDRIVKRFFAAHEGRDVSLQQGGTRWEGELPRLRRVTRHAVTASEAEQRVNIRSRSAKLRVAERI